MYRIIINGKANGNVYYGREHAERVAKGIRTRRANKGETVSVEVVEA